MIKETAAALGGVLSGLAAFLVVLVYPGASTGTATNTGIYRLIPITTPIYGPINAGPAFSGVPGIYSGVLPALVLTLLAVGAGIILSQVGRIRLKGEDLS